jgi:hypothetical protein
MGAPRRCPVPVSLVFFLFWMTFLQSKVTESFIEPETEYPVLKRFKLSTPKRKFDGQTRDSNQFTAPSINEITLNMTIFLSNLHSQLSAITGPTVTAIKVWDTFLSVMRSSVLVWDEQNKHRFPYPRRDSSIFVSLGTYRDPFCPMTIKSLFSNAKFPERIFVSLFQQNCFGPKCHTGVLVGGKVEDAGPDPDCYVEFCNSSEGIASNACNTGQIRLFNVNESESLGPYMARYLGGT